MTTSQFEKEADAIKALLKALEPLDQSARERVTAYVVDALKLSGTRSPVATPSAPPKAAPVSSAIASIQRGQDILSLRELKQPASAVEMATVVAFYLSEVAPPSDRKTEITTADIETYFKQAKFNLPKTPKDTLPNARKAGYFDLGSSAGTYKLNPVGYNLAAHNLPREEGAKRTRRASTKKTSAPSKKKAAPKKKRAK